MILSSSELSAPQKQQIKSYDLRTVFSVLYSVNKCMLNCLVKHYLYLLDPSSTTSLVGRVIVCSLGEMSARGGLFTLGAEDNNENKQISFSLKEVGHDFVLSPTEQ